MIFTERTPNLQRFGIRQQGSQIIFERLVVSRFKVDLNVSKGAPEVWDPRTLLDRHPLVQPPRGRLGPIQEDVRGPVTLESFSSQRNKIFE